MKVIVGLGNPGSEYEDTRHNIGFMVIDKLGKELGRDTAVFSEEKKFKAQVAKVGDVLLVKPLTFVNNSGLAVGAIVSFYKLSPADVWLIHDDMDLPIGKVRIRTGGGSAGHHGVDSVIKILKTDVFTRFRLGIGHGKENIGPNADRKIHHSTVINFVLSRFHRGEAGQLKHLIKHGAEAVRIALTDGLDKAMGRFN